jgi:hypothetical protein
MSLQQLELPPPPQKRWPGPREMAKEQPQATSAHLAKLEKNSTQLEFLACLSELVVTSSGDGPAN